MKPEKYLVRIFVKGGIITPRYLLKILTVAKKMGNNHIFFGSKQDILFKVSKLHVENAKHELQKFDTRFILKDNLKVSEQNITSSYVTYDIMPSTSWISAGTYKDIMDGFNYIPKLNINITDPAQNLVPLFYGELNYVASQKENYWHLFIKLRFSQKQLEWSGLISSNDIPDLSLEIENILLEFPDISEDHLIELVKYKNKFYFLENSLEVKFSEGFFPYYEGLNPMLNGDKFWAGFYWKNNCYDIGFLESISKLCIKTNLQNICITPWKSFLVKSIKKQNLLEWQQIIGQFGINMRHSSFDLNWHLPLLSKSAYKLKNYISGEFNKIDIRTFGLTFSIDNTIAEKFTSIVIVRKPLLKYLKNFSFLVRYEIYYTKNFNLNSSQYILYASTYDKHDIIIKLEELCREFFIKLNTPKVKLSPLKITEINEHYEIYQCIHCQTIYDEKTGDLLNKVSAKTSFRDFPSDYCCSTCGGSKSDLIKLDTL